MTEMREKMMADLMEKIEKNEISPSDLNYVGDIILDIIRMLNAEKDVISTGNVSRIREFYRHEGDTSQKQANLRKLLGSYRKILVQIYGRFCGEAVLNDAEELVPIATDILRYFMRVEKTGYPMVGTASFPNGMKHLYCRASRSGSPISISWFPDSRRMYISTIGGAVKSVVFEPGLDNYREELRFLDGEWIGLAEVLDRYVIKGLDPEQLDDNINEDELLEKVPEEDSGICDYHAEVGCDLCVYRTPDGRCSKN